MTRYIFEITGEDEQAVISHLITDLEILQTRVLKFDFIFGQDKEELRKMRIIKKSIMKANKNKNKKKSLFGIFKRKEKNES